MKIVSWDEINTMCLDISGQILKSRFKVDVIIAIGRDGLIPSRMISNLLQIHEFFVVIVKHDVFNNKKGATITQSVSKNLHGKNVLIIDDAVETGKTLEKVTNHILELGAREIRTVVIYYNEALSTLIPDYYVNIKGKDDAIVYPWRKYGVLLHLIKKEGINKKSDEHIRLILKDKYGINIKLNDLKILLEIEKNMS